MIIEGSLLSALLCGIAFTAAGCCLYKALYRERYGHKHDFVIDEVNRLKDAVEISLKPVGNK